MNWDTKRQLLYGVTVVIAIVAISVFSLRDTLFPAPTCYDHKKNGYESGVDCGGKCALRCTEEVNPLTVLWSKALPVSKGFYDFVAMISNKNIDNASQQLGYTFTVYDEQGKMAGVLSGSTTAPLDGTFPIIIQNIPLPQAPGNVVTTINDGPHYKVLESPLSPTIKILEKHYEAGTIPRVYATIMNTKHSEINRLPIRALLYDDKDNVYAVGQTIVPVIQKEGIQEITFTWDTPLKVAPTRIGIYPIFNPFEAISY